MTDFRNRLYDRYVSAYKTKRLTEAQVQSAWRWFDSKYGPLFSSLNRTDVILDVGCGEGLMMAYLQMCGFTDVRGIDISSEQVELARAQGLAAQVADVFDYLQNTKTSFKLIVALDFVEHFRKEELLTLFDLFYQCLTPGGWLVLQTPNGSAVAAGRIIYGDLTHSTILNPGAMRQLLQYHDFGEISFAETSPIGGSPRAIARRLIWQMTRTVANLVRQAETGAGDPILTQNMICIARKSP